MNEEMRTETMELCVTACEKFSSNNEVRIYLLWVGVLIPVMYPNFEPTVVLMACHVSGGKSHMLSKSIYPFWMVWITSCDNKLNDLIPNITLSLSGKMMLRMFKKDLVGWYPYVCIITYRLNKRSYKQLYSHILTYHIWTDRTFQVHYCLQIICRN